MFSLAFIIHYRRTAQLVFFNPHSQLCRVLAETAWHVRLLTLQERCSGRPIPGGPTRRRRRRARGLNCELAGVNSTRGQANATSVGPAIDVAGIVLTYCVRVGFFRRYVSASVRCVSHAVAALAYLGRWRSQRAMPRTHDEHGRCQPGDSFTGPVSERRRCLRARVPRFLVLLSLFASLSGTLGPTSRASYNFPV